MAIEKNSPQNVRTIVQDNGAAGAVYGLGLIGALIYFLQRAGDLWEIVIGIIKAILWPAFLVYKALEVLKIT